MPGRMHQDEVEVDEALVRRLLAAQMPELAGLSISLVAPWGTDNAVWRLGDEFVVRLPRIHWAQHQPVHEAAVLSRLAHRLPIAVPEPIAVGEPGFGYPFRWSVQRWIPGTGAALERMNDPIAFACDLAHVVRELQAVPTDGAPPPRGRARPLEDYDRETRDAIAGASRLIDANAALEVWEEAMAAPAYDGDPVWVHGDLEGNCLLEEGRLRGIVDWASACRGDPAVDVRVVWSPLFTEDARRGFVDALGVDDATLARSRGAAVNQACAALPYYLNSFPLIVERSWHTLAALGIRALRDGRGGAGNPHDDRPSRGQVR